MTTHASRADQLARIERQIALVVFQREVYARHDKTEQIEAADAALWGLRMRWMEAHYAAWCWRQKRSRV